MHDEKSAFSPAQARPDPLSRVAVVIVSYRSAEHLRRLLPRLPLDRLAAVTVVDNSSDDDSVAVASAVAGVRVRAQERNLGFGAGCNVGAAEVPLSADLLLFLNPDATIDAESLTLLVGYLDVHPDCALAAPRLFRDGEPLTSSGDEARIATELRRFAPYAVAKHLPDRRHRPERDLTGPVTYVEGACMLLRRSAFEQVGGFDEAFFLFFEELDLGNRLRRVGWTVDLVAEARATHEVAASRRTQADNARPELVESTVRYLLKWQGRFRTRLFVFLSAIFWQVRVVRGQLRRAEARSYRTRARAVMRGER